MCIRDSLYDIPGQILLLHSLLVISLVKGLQLEALHRLRIPDAQCVHDPISIAHNRHIIGNRLYGLISLLFKVIAAVFVHIYIDIAAELNLFGILGTAQLKRVSICQPVIGNLYLVSVTNLQMCIRDRYMTIVFS